MSQAQSGREQLAGQSVSAPQTHQDRKRDVLRFVDMSPNLILAKSLICGSDVAGPGMQ